MTILKRLRQRLGVTNGTVLAFSAENGRLIAVKFEEVDAVSKVYGYLERRQYGRADEATARGLMLTAIDTNVLIDIFGAHVKFGVSSAEALRRCLREGEIVACEVVWAKAAGIFRDIGWFVHAMEQLPVSLPPSRSRRRAHGAVIERPARRKRIIVDFLIGARASVEAHLQIEQRYSFPFFSLWRSRSG